MGLKDRHILYYILNNRFRIPRGTNDDERFGREVYVLLVFNNIGGYGLVTEFAQLYPDFVGGNLVRSAAYDGPVYLFLYNIPCRFFYYFPHRQDALHLIGDFLEFAECACDAAVGHGPQDLCEIQNQDIACNNLRVKCLR